MPEVETPKLTLAPTQGGDMTDELQERAAKVRAAEREVLKRKIQLAAAAVHAIGGGIDSALQMDSEEIAIKALSHQLSQARELLRWALEESRDEPRGGAMATEAKRLLLLTDDELQLIVGWAEVARDGVLHEFEEDDADVLAKIEEARLK